jgi:hypothetical protein
MTAWATSEQRLELAPDWLIRARAVMHGREGQLVSEATWLRGLTAEMPHTYSV